MSFCQEQEEAGVKILSESETVGQSFFFSLIRVNWFKLDSSLLGKGFDDEFEDLVINVSVSEPVKLQVLEQLLLQLQL